MDKNGLSAFLLGLGVGVGIGMLVRAQVRSGDARNDQE